MATKAEQRIQEAEDLKEEVQAVYDAWADEPWVRRRENSSCYLSGDTWTVFISYRGKRGGVLRRESSHAKITYEKAKGSWNLSTSRYTRRGEKNTESRYHGGPESFKVWFKRLLGSLK